MDPNRITLRVFYERAYRPLFLSDARPPTLVQYADSLKRWDQAFEQTPLGRITSMLLAEWREQLLHLRGRSQPTISAHTANKHLRHIQSILNKAGPRGPRNRDALGLLTEAPWIRPLRADLTAPHHYNAEQLHDLYEAGFHVSPAHDPTWWSSLIAGAYNLALRRRALLGITWEMLDLHACLLRLPAALDKTRQSRTKPFATCFRRELLRRPNRHRGPVWPWHLSATTWDRHWNRVKTAAGVQGTFHDLKRTIGTELSRIAPEWVVRHHLDHAFHDTTSRYVASHALIADYLEQLPQPWPEGVQHAHAR